MHETRSPRPRRPLPVWLPWLAAPAFALLPVAGCGAAATLRHGHFKAATASGHGPRLPAVPVAAVVTALPTGR